jgi:hypothetical protein
MAIRIKGNQLGGFGITGGAMLVLSSIFSPEFQLKTFLIGIGVIFIGIIFNKLTNRKKDDFN